MLSSFLLLSMAGVCTGGVWGSWGQVEMVGDLLNLPILLSFLSPFPSPPLLIPSPITLPPSAPWLPLSVVWDSHCWVFGQVRSGQKRNMEQTDPNTGLGHLACIFGSGCAICGCRLKTILAVINRMRHGLNKILYYVIGAYTIPKIKH